MLSLGVASEVDSLFCSLDHVQDRKMNDVGIEIAVYTRPRKGQRTATRDFE